MIIRLDNKVMNVGGVAGAAYWAMVIIILVCQGGVLAADGKALITSVEGWDIYSTPAERGVGVEVSRWAAPGLFVAVRMGPGQEGMGEPPVLVLQVASGREPASKATGFVFVKGSDFARYYEVSGTRRYHPEMGNTLILQAPDKFENGRMLSSMREGIYAFAKVNLGSGRDSDPIVFHLDGFDAGTQAMNRVFRNRQRERAIKPELE